MKYYFRDLSRIKKINKLIKENIMAVSKLLNQIIGMNLSVSELSHNELIILEAHFFTLVCMELKECFKSEQKDYFSLIKYEGEMEHMMEANFANLVIKDIIATGEYTSQGIAYYVQAPEDVICDILIGRNMSPSIALFVKIIELHRSVRKELYHQITKKMIACLSHLDDHP
jgi:hypothetical protein